jgi:hypothetical protein
MWEIPTPKETETIGVEDTEVVRNKGKVEDVDYWPESPASNKSTLPSGSQLFDYTVHTAAFQQGSPCKISCHCQRVLETMTLMNTYWLG